MSEFEKIRKDEEYMFLPGNSNFNRTKRRSSILKCMDNNFGYDTNDRRASRRVSFAPKLQCLELRADGTTQLVTEPFNEKANHSNDKPTSCEAPREEVTVPESNENRNKVMRKKQRSSGEFLTILKREYKFKNENYEIFYNTSCNRIGKNVLPPDVKAEITKLFTAEDQENGMELTNLNFVQQYELQQSRLNRSRSVVNSNDNEQPSFASKTMLINEDMDLTQTVMSRSIENDVNLSIPTRVNMCNESHLNFSNMSETSYVYQFPRTGSQESDNDGISFQVPKQCIQFGSDRTVHSAVDMSIELDDVPGNLTEKSFIDQNISFSSDSDNSSAQSLPNVTEKSFVNMSISFSKSDELNTKDVISKQHHTLLEAEGDPAEQMKPNDQHNADSDSSLDESALNGFIPKNSNFEVDAGNTEYGLHDMSLEVSQCFSNNDGHKREEVNEQLAQALPSVRIEQENKETALYQHPIEEQDEDVTFSAPIQFKFDVTATQHFVQDMSLEDPSVRADQSLVSGHNNNESEENSLSDTESPYIKKMNRSMQSSAPDLGKTMINSVQINLCNTQFETDQMTIEKSKVESSIEKCDEDKNGCLHVENGLLESVAVDRESPVKINKSFDNKAVEMEITQTVPMEETLMENNTNVTSQSDYSEIKPSPKMNHLEATNFSQQDMSVETSCFHQKIDESNADHLLVIPKLLIQPPSPEIHMESINPSSQIEEKPVDVTKVDHQIFEESEESADELMADPLPSIKIDFQKTVCEPIEMSVERFSPIPAESKIAIESNVTESIVAPVAVPSVETFSMPQNTQENNTQELNHSVPANETSSNVSRLRTTLQNQSRTLRSVLDLSKLNVMHSFVASSAPKELQTPIQTRENGKVSLNLIDKTQLPKSNGFADKTMFIRTALKPSKLKYTFKPINIQSVVERTLVEETPEPCSPTKPETEPNDNDDNELPMSTTYNKIQDLASTTFVKTVSPFIGKLPRSTTPASEMSAYDTVVYSQDNTLTTNLTNHKKDGECMEIVTLNQMLVSNEPVAESDVNFEEQPKSGEDSEECNASPLPPSKRLSSKNTPIKASVKKLKPQPSNSSISSFDDDDIELISPKKSNCQTTFVLMQPKMEIVDAVVNQFDSEQKQDSQTGASVVSDESIIKPQTSADVLSSETDSNSEPVHQNIKESCTPAKNANLQSKESESIGEIEMEAQSHEESFEVIQMSDDNDSNSDILCVEKSTCNESMLTIVFDRKPVHADLDYSMFSDVTALNITEMENDRTEMDSFFERHIMEDSYDKQERLNDYLSNLRKELDATINETTEESFMRNMLWDEKEANAYFARFNSSIHKISYFGNNCVLSLELSDAEGSDFKNIEGLDLKYDLSKVDILISDKSHWRFCTEKLNHKIAVQIVEYFLKTSFEEMRPQLLHRYRTTEEVYKLVDEVAQLVLRAEWLAMDLFLVQFNLKTKFLFTEEKTFTVVSSIRGMFSDLNVEIQIDPITYPFKPLKPILIMDVSSQRIYPQNLLDSRIKVVKAGQEKYMLNILQLLNKCVCTLNRYWQSTGL